MDFYELIKVEKRKIGDDVVNSINARDLHKALEIKTKFSDWIKRVIGRASFEEGYDYIVFSQNRAKMSKGRPTKEYIFTIDSGKEVAMLEDSDLGKRLRRYFIEFEKQHNKTKSKDELLIEALLEKGEIQNKYTNLLEEVASNKPLMKLSNILTNAIKIKHSDECPINNNPHLIKYTYFMTVIGLNPLFAKSQADELLKDLGLIYRTSGSFKSDYRPGNKTYEGKHLFIYASKKHRHNGALCVHPDGILILGKILHEANESYCKENGYKIDYTTEDFINAYNRVKLGQVARFV